METSLPQGPGAARRLRRHEQDWLFARAFIRQIEAVLAKVAKRPVRTLLVESGSHRVQPAGARECGVSYAQ
jgi:hypothetical protein